MSNGAIAGAVGATTAAVAANAIADAIKASGAIVRVKPPDFETILKKADEPLVVFAETGIFSTKYQYLTPYKGLVFFTKNDTELLLPKDCEIIRAKKISIPD